MKKVKIAIIFYSATGANYRIARWAEAAAIEHKAEVRLLKVRETAPEEAISSNKAWKHNVAAMQKVKEVSLSDLEWADALFFCTPTRYGAIPAQLKQFIDTTGGLWSEGKLSNKTVSCTATTSNPHGGQEATILSLYTQMMHWGCIIVAPGYTDPVTFKSGGNPYGVSATVDMEGNILDDIETGIRYQVKRLINITSGIART